MADRSGRAVVEDRPLVGLCTGKDCRKRCEFAKLRKALRRDCDVVELKCVGHCKGPVVVTQADAACPVVVAKVRSKRDRAAARALAGGQGDVVELDDLIVSRRKVLASVERRLAEVRSSP